MTEDEEIEIDGNVPAFGHGNPEQGGAAGLTKRQYAAINLKVPDSGLDWLDEMILKARQEAMAGQVIHGTIMNPELHRGFIDPVDPEDTLGTKLMCEEVHRIADAMIEAGKL